MIADPYTARPGWVVVSVRGNTYGIGRGFTFAQAADFARALVEPHLRLATAAELARQQEILDRSRAIRSISNH